MNTELAVGAAVCCALCNAVAAVLQKSGSDKVTAIRSYNIGVMFRLFRQVPYTAGIIVDLIAGVCTLVAVNRLPLFIVQAVTASCVVLTAFLEQIFLKRKLRRQIYYAALVVLVGLAFLALAAHSERTATVSSTVKEAMLAAPVFLLLMGTIAIRLEKRLGAAALATLSGAGFGSVSIIGRMLVYPTPFWMVLKNPLAWALIACGVLALYFFTAALQRSLATIVNGVMTSVQTVVPLFVGVLWLGDTARDGLWAFIWIGCALVVSGCVYIAVSD